MVSGDVITFHNDDDGYEQWVFRNDGYVLIQRTGRSFMLHDSECSHLGKDNDINLTAKPRRWAKTRRVLVAWTEAEVGEQPLKCSNCM